MKTNHRRANPAPKNHHPWVDRWSCYSRGHKGAAEVRKGLKKAVRVAERRLGKEELRVGDEGVVHITSTFKMTFSTTIKRLYRPAKWDGNPAGVDKFGVCWADRGMPFED